MTYGHLTAPQAALTEDGKFADTNARRAAKATKPVRAPKAPNSPCRCGCGSVPNKQGSRYLPGHDGRHKGQLLASAHGGDEQALATLVSLGWGKFFVPRKAKSS